MATEMRKQLLGASDGQQVYAIDFNQIEADAVGNMDVIVGANHERYPDIVPEGEIWVDSNLSPESQRHTILHELVERRLMRDLGWDYETQAHPAANRVEFEYLREIEAKAKYSRIFDPGHMQQQLLERYYRQSPEADLDAWWAGGNGSIVVIQEGQPLRYSRGSRGTVTVEKVA